MSEVNGSSESTFAHHHVDELPNGYLAEGAAASEKPNKAKKRVSFALPETEIDAPAYAVQMSECSACAKNTATVNTMLGVMQQQASTLKEQQGTIANLIAMLSNTNGSQKTTPVTPRPAVRTATPRQVLTVATAKKPVALRRLATKGSSSAFSSPSSSTSTRSRGRPSALSRPASESKPPTGKRSSQDEGRSSSNGPSPKRERATPNYAEMGDGDDDSIAVTKIWIRGTPHEKAPCPLPECANRKFAAADMYYLRRHFQQVHRITHPNPMFVIQCPVDDCGAEFEGSLRDMRKHLLKEHEDLYPKLPSVANTPRRGPTQVSEDNIEEFLEDGDGQQESDYKEEE